MRVGDRVAECAGRGVESRVVNRDHHNRDVRLAAQDGLGGGNTAHSRHDDVHEYKVRDDSFDYIDRFFAAAGMTNENEAWRRADEVRQRVAEALVVIGDQDANRVSRNVIGLPPPWVMREQLIDLPWRAHDGRARVIRSLLPGLADWEGADRHDHGCAQVHPRGQ